MRSARDVPCYPSKAGWPRSPASWIAARSQQRVRRRSLPNRALPHFGAEGLFLPIVQATKTWNDAIASRVAASDKGAARDAGGCLRSPRWSRWMRAPIAVCGRLFHGGGREALATYRTDAAVGKLLIGVLRLEARRYRYPATAAALPLSAVSAQVCRSSATVSCGPALDRSGAPAS